MITDKEIEEAKKAFIADKKILGIVAMNDLACGFTAGAHWAIEQFLKDLWHPASEEPKMLMPVVVEYKDGTNLGYDYHELLTTFKNKEETWQEYMDDWYGKGNTTRWFYINDVVPKQKGGEQ